MPLTSLCFNNFSLVLNPIFMLCFLWFFFFKVNCNFTKKITKHTTHIHTIKLNPNLSFIGYCSFLVFLNYVYVYTIRGKNSLILYNHLNVNNYTISMLYLFTCICIMVFFLLKCVIRKTNLTKSIDYLFSISNITILLPYLFFANTIFTFLFVLEFISTLLLYKLISSKIWFKNQQQVGFLNNNVPQNYINMVFFQYWVTFLSTIFIVYFYINMFCLYGTSDWFLIQFCSEVEYPYTTNNVYLRILSLVFIIGVLFKLGVTPFHLFKVEVYKGVPLLSIFFYTTYYFIVFFLFFLFFLSDFLLFFKKQFYFLLLFLVVFGLFFVLSLMFDVSFIKVFFTYSTVINTIGFLIAFLSNM